MVGAPAKLISKTRAAFVRCMPVVDPSPNGPSGRDSTGRFAQGNPGGPGNPYAKRVAALRGAMLEAVTKKDMAAILGKLVELAKSGSVPAAKEVLDRCLGRSLEADLLERMEQLEGQLAARIGR